MFVKTFLTNENKCDLLKPIGILMFFTLWKEKKQSAHEFVCFGRNLFFFLDLQYKTFGEVTEANQHPPILMVHGFFDSLKSFSKTIANLLDNKVAKGLIVATFF